MTQTVPQTLAARYDPDDLAIFDDEERARFLDGADPWPQIAWDILYRKEPDLYEALIAGERIHPEILARLPAARRAVEVAAGSGRLTVEIAPRCRELVAVEPAGPLRAKLAEKLPGIDVRRGFFDAIPVPDRWADLVVSCSAFSADDRRGGATGLQEMERITAPGGMIALVWPSDVDWLRQRGFSYESFEEEMDVEFASLDEAVELARIFYPHATDEIAARGSERVPYDLLGMNPPCDIVWKRVP